MPMCIDVGYASFVDCERFTWSCGSRNLYSPFLWPISSRARFAITSFAFMFVDVPAPPWSMSSWNWSWSLPSMISWHAFSIAVRISLENPPVSKFARAAASFTIASALMKLG